MSSTASVIEEDNWCYKMKDLCNITGLGRQAIHFYIQQGLIPPGRKTGHNMAWYSEKHLERIQMIRKLQHERFLPLKAIKAILDEQDALFSPTQRNFLKGLRQSISIEGMSTDDLAAGSVPAAELVASNVISEADLNQLIEAQVIGTHVDEAGNLRISQKDIESLKILTELRQAGFTEEQGFHASLIQEYEKSIAELVNWEGQLVADKLRNLPPDQAAQVVQSALPIVHKLLIHYHQLRITDLLASL